MKIIILLLLPFIAACGSKPLSEARARELATIEFQKICSKINTNAADYSEPKPANVRGKDIQFSYIWYSRRGERSIIVRVAKDGLTEASFGLDMNPTDKPKR